MFNISRCRRADLHRGVRADLPEAEDPAVRDGEGLLREQHGEGEGDAPGLDVASVDADGDLWAPERTDATILRFCSEFVEACLVMCSNTVLSTKSVRSGETMPPKH